MHRSKSESNYLPPLRPLDLDFALGWLPTTTFLAMGTSELWVSGGPEVGITEIVWLSAPLEVWASTFSEMSSWAIAEVPPASEM